MRDHIKILGVLDIVWASITIVMGLVVLLIFGGLAGFLSVTGAANNDTGGILVAPFMAILGVFIVAIVCIVSLPALTILSDAMIALGGWIGTTGFLGFSSGVHNEILFALAGDPSAVTDTSASTTRVGSTTNLTVTDRWGNVVDYTFTIEQTGGNGMVVPGYGFLLNNELTDFNLTTDPDGSGKPNPPGGVSTGANKVEGGKRPRSSIAPTYVERDGRPFLAVGSPGGATIITTVLQILTERIDFGRTLPQAIADPRASQRNPAATATNPNSPTAPEQAFLDGYKTALEAKGHTFSAAAEIGAATGIEFLPGGRMLAAAEPVRRGGGSAEVVRP